MFSLDFFFCWVQRRSTRMCGRSPLLFTDYLTDFDEADAQGAGGRFSRRSGNKRANIRLEDRRFGELEYCVK